MCLDSNSSSSSSSSQTSQQFDERIAAADGGIAVRLDNGAVIELTDPGIIAAARDAFVSFENIQAQAIDFAKSESAQANALSKEVLDRARTESAQAVEQVLKIGAVVAVVALIATQGPRFLKGRV